MVIGPPYSRKEFKSKRSLSLEYIDELEKRYRELMNALMEKLENSDSLNECIF